MSQWCVSCVQCGVHMSQHRNRAFTIIEILVVVSIIAVLASIMLIAVNSGRDAANTAKSVVKLKQITEWMNLWSNDNNDRVLPSQFDYTLEASMGQPISVRRDEHAEDENLWDGVDRGQYQGTWADILWTENGLIRTFGLIDFEEEGDHTHLIWESNSPGNDIYDLYEDFDNPFRSIHENTRGHFEGLPGYFAANDFFDARSGEDGNPNSTDTTDTQDRYYTYAMLHAPARSLYLVDSVAGETISNQAAPWQYDFYMDSEGQLIDPNTTATQGEVDYRYNGNCMVLLLDGSMKSLEPWSERGPLSTPADGRDTSLLGHGIRVHQLTNRKIVN